MAARQGHFKGAGGIAVAVYVTAEPQIVDGYLSGRHTRAVDFKLAAAVKGDDLQIQV